MNSDLDNVSHSLQSYYIEQAIKEAQKLQKRIFLENGFSETPLGYKDLTPVPVFEDCKCSLLSFTNSINDTKITWVKGSNYRFLPAYYKKYASIDGVSSHQIVINELENYCESRLLAAKELMHSHLTEIPDAATKTELEIDSLVEELIITYEHNKVPTMVDKAAWFGAVEFLIPSSWIPALKKLYDEICLKHPQESEKAYLYIAQIIRVPESIVRYRLANAK